MTVLSFAVQPTLGYGLRIIRVESLSRGWLHVGAGFYLALDGWTFTGDVRTFGDICGQSVEGLDECGVIAGACEIHGVLEFDLEVNWENGQSASEIDLDGVDASLTGVLVDGGFDLGVGKGLALPILAHGIHCGLRGFGEGDLTLDLDVDQLLGLIVGEAEFFEDRDRGFIGGGIKGVVVGCFEFVLVWDAGCIGRRRRGFGFGSRGIRRRCRRREVRYGLTR